MTVTADAVLDQLAALPRRDPEGMLFRIASLPRQIEDGWARTRELELPERVREARAVAVLGMGGSAAAGDLVRSVFSDRLSVPLVSVRDYELPAWVDRETLVVAISHSGGTEETIAALAVALERRCPVAIITTGGALREVASRTGLPLLTYPAEGQPRAAVGYTMTLLAGLLERAGLLALTEAEIRGAVTAASTVAADCGPDVPSERNPAKQLAWALLDRLPIVEGSGFLAAVARRWKTQLNENAKTMAVAEELPEATHNTVVGHDQPENVRDHLYVVFLAASTEHPRNRARATLSADLLTEARILHQVVPIGGEGRFAQAASAIALGDYTSAYLALLYDTDPTPVAAIGHVKAGMAALDDDASSD